MTGRVGEIVLAPWRPFLFVPIATPWGAVQFLTGALTVPGATFSIASGDTVAIWICRE